jgi:serine/threonine protein kinase
MTGNSTATEFLSLVAKSGLVTAKQLDEFFGGNPPDDPTAAANELVRGELLTPYQSKLLLAGKFRGFLLGPYKLLRPLGQGGMGVVFLAEHTGLGRQVAVKVLAADKAKDRLALERFQREARAAAALSHPNIVTLHDISQGNGVHFLVMEYVEGNDLQSLMAQTGPLHYAQAADYVAQAAAGLHHAHQKGFIHRDVKPANLMLAKDGAVKVLDMGLARSFADDRDNLTGALAEGDVTGTVDFLSPEQALSHDLDQRTDIYSLGATFYALLTGHPPFTGTTAQKLLQHQVADPPAVTKKLRGRVPPALSDVIATMMAKSPADRYQTAEEVIDALGPWLPAPTTGNVVRDPVSQSDLIRKPTSRKPRKRKTAADRPVWKRPPVLVGAGVGLAALIGLIALASGGGKKPDAAPPAGETTQGTPAQGAQAAPRATAAAGPQPAGRRSPAAAPAVRGKFQMLSLDGAASAPAGGPLFAHHPGDRLPFDEWGEQTVHGVPFLLPDPSDTQPNIITLYGPMSEPTRRLPRSARLPVNAPVRTFHFLSGVSAWGWPFEGTGAMRSEKGTTAVVVRIEYADGTAETHEWKNGEEFADYAGRHDVPGSEAALFTRNKKQVRYLTLTPRRADQAVAAVEFVKGEDDNTSPAVVAVTVERPGTATAGGGVSQTPPKGPAATAAKLVPLDLTRAATTVLPAPPAGTRWGTNDVGGVSFDLADPRGGRRPNAVRPGVKIPCFLAAKAVHVLATSAGGKSPEPLRVRFHYPNGTAEVATLTAKPGGEPALSAAAARDEAATHLEFEAAPDALVVGVTVETR